LALFTGRKEEAAVVHTALDDCFNSSWKYNCKSRVMLEVLVCHLRTLQIKLFLNMINAPIHDILEM
jgi:hypothetical protein